MKISLIKLMCIIVTLSVRLTYNNIIIQYTLNLSGAFTCMYNDFRCEILILKLRQ